MTARNATADWHGDLEAGGGQITIGDDVFRGPYSYQSRIGEATGTNPEQLVAGALAGCFTMGLTAMLSADGHAPESLATTSRVQLRNVDGAPTLTRIDLVTTGLVADITQEQFAVYAERSRDECPIARALAGIPEITVSARLSDVSAAPLASTSSADGR